MAKGSGKRAQSQRALVMKGGFIALPIAIESAVKTTLSDGTSTNPPRHVLYFKEHSLRKTEADLPKGRSLFVLNIPLGGQGTLKSVFSEAGEVEHVILRDMTTGSAAKGTLKTFPAAYVVFKDKASLQRALAMKFSDERRLRYNVDGGLKRFQSAYDALRMPRDELQAQVDAAIASFDDDKAREQAARMASAEADEEGWTLVTTKTQVDVDDGEESKNAPGPKKKRSKKQKAGGELKNFYRFQRLEAHKTKLALLRKRFDEDKHRMEHLRSTRKFRPF